MSTKKNTIRFQYNFAFCYFNLDTKFIIGRRSSVRSIIAITIQCPHRTGVIFGSLCCPCIDCIFFSISVFCGSSLDIDMVCISDTLSGNRNIGLSCSIIGKARKRNMFRLAKSNRIVMNLGNDFDNNRMGRHSKGIRSCLSIISCFRSVN